MEEIPLLWLHALHSMFGQMCRVFMKTHETCEVAPFTHLLIDRFRHFPCFIPFSNIRLDFRVYPFADLFAKSGVGLAEVW